MFASWLIVRQSSQRSDIKAKNMINLMLFMMPVGVDIEHASTIRQAKAMGAKQVWHGSAGGPS
jgi:hypothetical protein